MLTFDDTPPTDHWMHSSTTQWTPCTAAQAPPEPTDPQPTHSASQQQSSHTHAHHVQSRTVLEKKAFHGAEKLIGRADMGQVAFHPEKESTIGGPDNAWEFAFVSCCCGRKRDTSGVRRPNNIIEHALVSCCCCAGNEQFCQPVVVAETKTEKREFTVDTTATARTWESEQREIEQRELAAATAGAYSSALTWETERREPTADMTAVFVQT